MNPLSFLPTSWLWPAAGIAGLALTAALGVQTVRVDMGKRDIAELQSQIDKDRADAEKFAREHNEAVAVAVQGAMDAKDKEVARARAAAAGARDELGRLRDTIATLDAGSGATPADPGRPDDAAQARSVVGQCANALAEMGEIADACESRVIGLQGYIRALQPQP